ncbi:probable WRKY transcription factor 51 [Populus alba]|uniref:WRKY transcription factor 16 n=1 Tax=Populus alba TaxID=43335 RepID=A0A4U5QNG4_POPAL|nr:probable WRKY transcription factor 51 isoform X2 [Populus alba]TKS12374.1 WRKY transcription factor 16 [Populus alba]
MDYPQNPKPSCNYSYTNEGLDPWTIELQPSDYLMLDDGFGEDSSSQNMVSSEQVASGSSTGYSGATSRNNSIKCKNGVNKNKTEEEHRVAFRTKSDLEIMDDGYKWRKYGKKSVKNSPNPRNYYKCSSSGCNVKKRVERDREDSRYVLTSYDGVHNHESPSNGF